MVRRPWANHGVTRVDGHVNDCHVELRGVGDHEVAVFGDVHHQLHFGAHQCLDHAGQGPQVLCRCEHCRLQCLTPGEGKQLRGDFGGSFDGVGDG